MNDFEKMEKKFSEKKSTTKSSGNDWNVGVKTKKLNDFETMEHIHNMENVKSTPSKSIFRPSGESLRLIKRRILINK